MEREQEIKEEETVLLWDEQRGRKHILYHFALVSILISLLFFCKCPEEAINFELFGHCEKLFDGKWL